MADKLGVGFASPESLISRFASDRPHILDTLHAPMIAAYRQRKVLIRGHLPPDYTLSTHQLLA